MNKEECIKCKHNRNCFIRSTVGDNTCLKLKEQEQEIDRLKKIARKMHTWIFLHSSDEQKVYDELGLTDEENTMLGYSGQIKIEGDKE